MLTQWARPLVILMAALVLFCGAGAVLAPVASAHAKLLRTDPVDRTALKVGPQRVTFTFNEVMQQSYPVIVVIGPDGNTWQDGDPVFSGPTVSVAVKPLGPVGEYTVNYKLTSADGHVVHGAMHFTLTVAGTGTPGPKADTNSGGHDSGFPVWPIVIGVVVVVVLGAGVAVVIRRRSA